MTSSIIIYQDFKSRRINLFMTLVFITLILMRYFTFNAGDQMLLNTLFCMLYFALSYLVLRLYFYVKGRGNEKVLDSKIGWGDIILLFAAGCTIEPEKLVFFFTITFVLSLAFHLLFFKKSKAIPLAAYLLIFYNAYLLLGF